MQLCIGHRLAFLVDAGALGYLHIQIDQIEILSQFLGKLCLGICAAIVNERPGMVDIDGDRQVVIVVALLVGVGGQLQVGFIDHLVLLGTVDDAEVGLHLLAGREEGCELCLRPIRLELDGKVLAGVDLTLEELIHTALIAGAEGHDVACLTVVADDAGIGAGAVVESPVVVGTKADDQRLALLVGIVLQGIHGHRPVITEFLCIGNQT